MRARTLFPIPLVVAAIVGLPASTGALHPSQAAASPASPPWLTLLAPSAVAAPTGIAIDLRGSGPTKWAYVADASNQRIVKFGTGGKLLGSWQYGNPKNRGTAAGVAVGSSGNVVVADPAMNRLSRFTPSGKLLNRWTGFQGPNGLAIDGSGNVYVSESWGHRVTKLSPKGRVLRRWDTHRLWDGNSAGNPTGIALDPPPHSIYVSTTCRFSVTCAKRVDYLSGCTTLGLHCTTDSRIDVLFPLSAQTLGGDRVGMVGLAYSSTGVPQALRDQCNNRFVKLQGMAKGPNGRLYVAGLLWPRVNTTAALAVGLGPGEAGCTHDGLGPSWTTWPLPTQQPVHGMAVDGVGAPYVTQGNQVLKLSP